MHLHRLLIYQLSFLQLAAVAVLVSPDCMFDSSIIVIPSQYTFRAHISDTLPLNVFGDDVEGKSGLSFR